MSLTCDLLEQFSRDTDSSKPMPKARKHISVLAEQHEKQSRKIEELERLIAEVCIGQSDCTAVADP